LTELRYPNGVTETLAWNADDSLQRISHKSGASTLAQSTYTYDGLGRRKTLQETVSGLPTLTYTYQYDPLDRLTQVDNGTASQKQTYAYDIFGNRVQKQLGNPVSQTTAYQYDAAQQLTEVRQNSLAGTLLEADLYDEVGQLTQKCTGGTVTRPNDTSCSGSQVTQYAWTSFDRLGQVTGSTSASFRYDDQGRRIQKTEGGVATNYLYDGPNLYAEYPSAGWTTADALYVQAGLDLPLARLTGSIASPSATASYYHADGLGSLLALTNATGSVTATQRFDAFGLKLAGAGTVPTYGYTGREPDATGLVYYRARYYDPTVGRFTQRDPVGYLDGINRYAYVGNNPVNFTDPNGLLARQVGTWLDTQGRSYFNDYSGTAADVGVGFTPVGIYADVYGAATGKTLFGGQELSGWERALGLIPGVSEIAGVVRGVNKVDNLVDLGQAVTHGHHPIPQFLGGNAKQELTQLPQPIHTEFHQVLNQNLKDAGIPLNVGGVGGSRENWIDYMLANPGTQNTALDAVLDASRAVDQKYGTNITQDVWRNLMDDNFRQLP
jgi:RHS repeat-associated protein